MTDKTDQLKEIREKITRTDEEMAELFRRRMELVEQVGLYKKANSLPYTIRREKGRCSWKGRGEWMIRR